MQTNERSPRAGLAALALLLAPILACGFGSTQDDTPPEPPPPLALPVPAPTPVSPPSAPNMVNHETPGNLAPSRPALGCIEEAQIDSTMTPADLYPSMEACARADRPQPAFFLFALGGVYGRFDSFRVVDRSAHDAEGVIRRRHVDSVPPAQWEPVGTALRGTSGNPEELARFCARVRRVGPPTYRPDYMIRHGMGAFLDSAADPLVPSFDAVAAWERALESYIHCPPAGG